MNLPPLQLLTPTGHGRASHSPRVALGGIGERRAFPTQMFGRRIFAVIEIRVGPVLVAEVF